MAMTLSGPMFERARTGVWESVHHKDGGHYNNFGCRDAHGMRGLREMFPSGEAGALNFVLFSTSGVHGTYTLIEEAERAWRFNAGLPLDPPFGEQYDEADDLENAEDGKVYQPGVTFLIVHPRVCTVRHGNCEPQTEDDWAFLRRLRETSWTAAQCIGRPTE